MINPNKFSKICIFCIVLIFCLLPVFGLDKSVKEIGADVLYKFGLDGSNNTICVIDTGIDYTHENLGGCNGINNCSKIIGGYDFLNSDSDPFDTNGHGTEVVGIIISNHSSFRGVASGSKIVSLRAVPGTWQALNKSIAWCVDNSTKFGITIVSMSLGDSDPHTDATCTDFADIKAKISEGVAKGIVFIAASGNEGETTGINYPACLPNVTSVGSVNRNDEVARHSNRFSNLDLLAPGVGIKSTKLGGGLSAGKIQDFICGFSDPVGGDFWTYCDGMAGTSFATPHVAGAFALVRQYDTAMKSNDIERLLKTSGKKIYDSATGLNFSRIDLLSALNILDWPTENHDYRRTGFTLLKGDLTDKSKTKSAMDFFLDAGDGMEQVVKPSIADIDADGVMDIVTLVHKSTSSDFTKMYGIEAKKPFFGKPARKWKDPVIISNGEEGGIYFPPTLANVDGDINKEIITGNRNGTVFVYDYANGKITQKWNYTFESRSDGLNNRVKFNGGSAVTDIDLDGDMEIIVADVLDNDDEWPGKVYVLDGNDGTNQTSYIVGNGGAYASVSIANVDSDDYPEIIVPTQYGIKVLDYNLSTNKLTEKCSNTHGLIEGSAVIYDVDRDNEYELIYVTNSRVCASGETCNNKLYVIDAGTCSIELNKDIDGIPRPTPTIANLDSDSQMEIIIASVVDDGGNPNSALGNVTAIDSSTGNVEWIYNAGGTLHPGSVSPNIADIDNDGNYNIILGENDGSTVYILKEDGTLLFDYEVIGFMDNGLAIADLDNDGVAEIAFKRAASPETVFVSVSAINTPPEIIKTRNVTAIAGELINLSNLLSTSDAEGNNVQIIYSSPFNDSGQWQTTINDTGNYSILVEVSDGNLSTTQFIDVIVFNDTSKVANTFSDNSKSKLLNFTQPGNLTINIRLPKNATVVYSKIKIEGLSP